MRFLSLAVFALLAVLTITSVASSAAAPAAPANLHGFLLRADEGDADTFHRTPSFAWDPFPATVAYQFQLSMSSTFRENSVFYDVKGLKSPVVAPPLRLPWITGSPHSLYARVRATTNAGDVTPWTEYGFDVVAPAAPKPVASDPGLLRWTPAEGATQYQVWLVDVPQGGRPGLRMSTVHTNVLDEREFYTFHPSQKWIGTVRWRIRAARATGSGGPANGLPATTYGPWSPVYSSSNPNVTGGKITLLHTTSDVVSTGEGSPAHRLMPAFTWTGNQALTGVSGELYRVYVFTDSSCLNNVFTSAPVGSPAYASRPGGTIQLPQDSSGIAAARGTYLDPGTDSGGETYDGSPVAEGVHAASPISVPPTDQDPAPAPGAEGGATGGGASGGGAAPPPATATPTDLWDTDNWPKSGYYWTVVAVSPTSMTAASSTVAAPGASKLSSLLPVSDTSGFKVGQSITIGVAPDSDTVTISGIGNGLLTLSAPLNNGHAVGDPIASTASGGVVYRDMELPQDVCASGRVGRFGISSEPPLTSAQEPFATGLSKNGALISAESPATFYGQPLVAWAPSLSADTYQVQWSKKAYPFTPEGSITTASTATMLPLTVGTWYYRVRGFDNQLPTGAQMLSWTDTEQLTIAPPTFKVFSAPKKKFRVIGKK